MYEMPTCINVGQIYKVCLSVFERKCVCVFGCVSITDIEAVQQYEKMLSIEEVLMGAEPDVNIEEITGVSCLSTA